MKLTVLGKYGPFPAPGGACSGYLLEADDVRLLLDCGSGVMSRLYGLSDGLRLDGILLTHLHSDHMADMLVLRYALQQLTAKGKNLNVPLPVVCPDEPEAEFRQLSGSGVYEILAARDGLRLRFGTLTVTLHRMAHPVTSFAMDIEHQGRRLFYTGDTGYVERLESLCAGADVLLADTCFVRADRPAGNAAHLSAEEAAEIAKKANIGQLLCTHIWGGGTTDAQILREAAAIFPNALVVEELHEYSI